MSLHISQSLIFSIMYKVLSIKYLKKIFFLSILATLYLLLNTAPAGAEALSLGIDPPIIEINAIPPATAVSSLNIQNKSDTQVTLQIQLKPFKTKGENGELEYSKKPLQIFGNIQILDANVPVESVTLGPKQQKTLTLNVNLPKETNISDYYFSVVFVSANTSAIESNSSVNQIGIAANVLLSVGPKQIPRATLEEFSAKIFHEKGPVPFTVRIKNEGAHFIKPKGEISIKNMFGQSIGKLDLFSANVLSDSIRAIPNKNSFDFKHPIALWRESFLLGLYTATLNISMSDEGPTFTKVVRFFAFPFQILIIIVLITIAAIVVKNRLKLYMTHR